MGLRLTKIHRCISYEQSAWLKPWIDLNTEKRKEAKNDFEKDLFKLTNNAVYGKTMEDVRNHADFELVNNKKRLEKVLSNPNMKHRHIVNNNLIGVEKTKTHVRLNKPIAVGFTILDTSKLHMYKYHYGVMKERYGDNVRLCYTDTDSFLYHIYTGDMYKDLKEIGEHMDFSDYPETHPNYDQRNKQLGKFKDEFNGKPIAEYIGLKPKMKTIRGDDGHTDNTAKGVARSKVKSNLTFETYRKTLFENYKERINSNSIRSHNHQITSLTTSKSGLSNFDHKRYYLSNLVSLPYGPYRISN